jgi:phospholipase D1/2
MEQKSGIKFYDAQVALARMWIGDLKPKEGEWVPTEVTIRIPQETGEGIVLSKKTEIKTEKVKIPSDEHEARRIIEQFESAAQDGELERSHQVSDNVVQHMLHDVTSLHQEQWEGTEEEELQSCVHCRYTRGLSADAIADTCRSCSTSIRRS